MAPTSTPISRREGIGNLSYTFRNTLHLQSDSIPSQITQFESSQASEWNMTTISDRREPAESTAMQIEPSMPIDSHAPSSRHHTVAAQSGIAPPSSSISGAIPIEIDSDSDPPQSVSRAMASWSETEIFETDEAGRRYERAQAMFKRYNVTFDEKSWEMHPKSHVERISKAPRMRIRWTCHQCRASFGHDKVCVECAHERCKICIRYPPRKKKSRILREQSESHTGVATNVSEICSRACHECQTVFDIGILECENCHHIICERCLTETVVRSTQLPLPDIAMMAPS